MNFYHTLCIIIVLGALIAYINQRFLKLPSSIGVMIIAVVISVVLMLTANIFPELFKNTIKLIDSVDFSNMLTGIILNFLLFAGTIQIRIKDLRQQQLSVMLFSTLSVIISTVLVGGMMYFILDVFNMRVPFLQCLLFGALISPTDPIAVLGMLKDSGLPKSLETKIAGESLFNDGVALLVFFTILHAIRNPEDALQWQDVVTIFVQEALGGLLVGVVIGFIGLRALKTIENYKVEVMLTLAIVMGGSLLAKHLHVSAPLTMVAAGIFIGNYGKKYAMTDLSIDYLDKFWELIEEILNIILFVMIGFELLIIKRSDNYWKIGAFSILIVLIARFVSIWLPSLLISMKEKINMRAVSFLTWGGLRGGISIALALTLTRGLHKDLFLFATYSVVLFSVIVQGLTIEKVLKKRKAEDAPFIIEEAETQS